MSAHSDPFSCGRSSETDSLPELAQWKLREPRSIYSPGTGTASRRPRLSKLDFRSLSDSVSRTDTEECKGFTRTLCWLDLLLWSPSQALHSRIPHSRFHEKGIIGMSIRHGNDPVCGLLILFHTRSLLFVASATSSSHSCERSIETTPLLERTQWKAREPRSPRSLNTLVEQTGSTFTRCIWMDANLSHVSSAGLLFPVPFAFRFCRLRPGYQYSRGNHG